MLSGVVFSTLGVTNLLLTIICFHVAKITDGVLLTLSIVGIIVSLITAILCIVLAAHSFLNRR